MPVYPNATATSPGFTVRWKKGGFDAKGGGVDTGHLETVSGDILQNGKKSSDYSAPRGDADRVLKRLKLSGGALLRSADGSQTLRAQAAEYRDGEKLIRAIGSVTATGPFGTLSGVPELWATPDLRLIGTPDMVSKTLKIPALAVLAATAATGSPVFQDTSRVLTGVGQTLTKKIDAKRSQITLIPASKGTPIHLVVPEQGLNLYADGTLVAIVRNEGKARIIESASTKDHVKAVQDATETTSGTTTVRHTEYEGPQVDYTFDSTAKRSTFRMGGPVQMTSVGKATQRGESGTGVSTLKGRGDDGVIVLEGVEGKADDRHATLTGNVRLDLLDVNAQGERRVANATGERLVYDADAKGGKTVLTGSPVKISGDGVGIFGDVQDAARATILLTPQNEWTDINLDAADGGGITTKVKLPPQKPKTDKTPPKKGGKA